MSKPLSTALLLGALLLLTLAACEPRQHQARDDAAPSSSDADPVEFCGQRLALTVQRVICHDPQVSDLVPLSRLRELLTLNLNDTQVMDLAPLAGHPRLLAIELERTRVSDVRPLSTITTLRSIRLRGSWVLDVMALVELDDLELLDVSATGVSLPQVVVVRHFLPGTLVTGP